MINFWIYKTKDSFVKKLQTDEVDPESIVFIEDTKEIWANNNYYPNIPDISNLVTKQELESKIDKEEGKSLVADSEIARLASVTNYDDTCIKSDIANLQTNKADKIELENYALKTDLSDLASKSELAEKADFSSLNGKVDKVEGKGLSTNDFTDDAVKRLNELGNKDTILSSVIWIGDKQPPNKKYTIWIDTSENEY